MASGGGRRGCAAPATVWPRVCRLLIVSVNYLSQRVCAALATGADGSNNLFVLRLDSVFVGFS